MISLIERPEPWSFSRNPIRYKFLTVQSLEVQVRLYVGTMDGNPANDKLINSYNLTPNPNGETECYVETDIDALLRWQMPEPQVATITPVTSQTASFFIEYRNIFTLGSTPSWTSEITNRRFAFKGGLPAHLFNRSLPTQFSYFTYQTTQAYVAVTDHFYRTFVEFDNSQTSSRTAQINILFSDNTTVTTNIAFPNSSNPVFHVPASPAAWGLVPFGNNKTAVSYKVVVNRVINGNTVSQVIADCEIDHNWYRESYAIQYHNSLGGLDHLRLTGDTDIENERSATDGERIIGGDYNEPAKSGQYFQRNISLQKTFKSDAGYFDSPGEQEVAQELDLSESVWILKPLSNSINQWAPIRILNKTRKLRSVSSKRWNFEVEWQYAYDWKAFSNLTMPGLGIDTNTYTPAVCGIVTGLQVSTTPYPVFAVTVVHWSWTAGTNNWQFTLQIREVGTTQWEPPIITGSNDVSLMLIPNRTFEWRVNAICSPTDVSAWVMGPNFTT